MTANDQHIETVLDFIKCLMETGVCPSFRSPESQRLSQAVGGLLGSPTDRDMTMLGLLALRLVIDRVSAGIATERAMNNLSQPGDPL